MTSSSEYTITLLGDVMLGRLIDQMLPTHVHEPGDAKHAAMFRKTHRDLQDYTYTLPWGNALTFLKSSDLVLANLETSVTTHGEKWPDKVFNYRMHPDNLRCLIAANVDCVSVANNHTLDYSLQGLLDTVNALKDAGIAFAGAGEDRMEADKPAILTLPRTTNETQDGDQSSSTMIHVYAFSDHPAAWAGVEQFNFFDYTTSGRQKVKNLFINKTSKFDLPALKIVSVHWGPNYTWQPDRDIRNMAHFFIDSCGVDVVWGHSSHHIQGVEVYKNKLIVYGCGDFVDDYAVVPDYRNDLSAAWNLKVERDGEHLEVRQLHVWPNKIQTFKAGLLERGARDHAWVADQFRDLCKALGTTVEAELGAHGQIIVDLSKQ